MVNSGKYWIAPSILNADQDNLEAEIDKVSQVADLLHLDIMDNRFVPNITLGIDRARELIKSSNIKFDTHLMVERPEEIAPLYAAAGSYSTTFHLEATEFPNETIKKISDYGSKVGIAIKPKTPIEELFPYLDKIDMALIMTVEPGFGGQSYISKMEEKIKILRKYLDEAELAKVKIEVDGGITESTIKRAADAGAEVFVAGSAVYRGSNPAEAVERLRHILL